MAKATRYVLPLVCLAMALLSLGGCSGQERVTLPFIMFFYRDAVADGAQEGAAWPMELAAVRGSWDLGNGTVALEDKPAFVIATKELIFPVVWDGGTRIVLPVTPGWKLELLETAAGSRVETLATPPEVYGGVVQALSGDGGILLAYRSDQQTNEIRVEIRPEGKEELRMLEPPFPSGFQPDTLAPLLTWGEADGFHLLALYEAGEHRGLLLAEVRGREVKWQEVEGIGDLSMAVRSPSVVKVGAKVFTSHNRVHVLDLAGDELALREFKPANDLIQSVEEEVVEATDTAVQPDLGVFADVLVLRVPSIDESWAWAFRGDRRLGTLHINEREKKVEVYRENKLTEEKALPEGLARICFPNGGCSGW
ncbi:MAG: hypothetical protein NUV99_01190 [Clostridia bacterium]|nr:hypothetical protein [Clostridia bacterium]